MYEKRISGHIKAIFNLVEKYTDYMPELQSFDSRENNLILVDFFVALRALFAASVLNFVRRVRRIKTLKYYPASNSSV